MTLQTTLAAGVPTPAEPASRWRTELTETIRLAWPIALTQLGVNFQEVVHSARTGNADVA